MISFFYIWLFIQIIENSDETNCVFGILSTVVYLTFGLSVVYAQGGKVDANKCITVYLLQWNAAGGATKTNRVVK